MKRFLTSASGSSSAAQPGSPYPDTCDAGVRSAEQPAEQNNFDPESRIDFYVCMYHSKVKPFDWPMPHSTPVPASSQSTHECVQKKRMMDANAHGEPSEPHGHAEPDITQQGQPSCGAEQPALKKLALNSPVLNSPRSVDITAGAELEATALTSLEHCARWLSTLTYRTDEPLRRLAEALGVLQAQPSRTRRSSIQSMLKSWGVPQYTNLPRSKIAAPQVEAMLMRKVLEEACRLKRLHHSHGSSSAIRLTLGRPPQNDDPRVRR